jgi:c(7)-type cytochrome triheme protein
MAGFGNGIDWETALMKGLVKPRNTLQKSLFTMPLPDKLKKPIRLGTISPRSDVSFSHEEHYAELDCSSCHPDIFNIKKRGTEAFSMERNVYGNYCGVCHMRVAFPMNDCKRCHPQMSNFSGF